MTALILSFIFSKAGAVLGMLAMGAGLLFAARKSGAKAERARQAASEAKARTIADEIDDAVAGRTPEENRARLRKWAR